MAACPFAIGFGPLLFVIRGYELTPGTLYVKRLLWRTPIDLGGLGSVTIDPNAMAKSLRTFGNGGLFSVSGRFFSRKLGRYRAYATNPKKSVALRFANHVAVVTPHDPEAFAAAIARHHHLTIKKEKKE